MDIATGAGRVRVHEPVPNVPSGAESLFAEYVRQSTNLTVVRMGISGALVVMGVGLAFAEGRGSALPCFYLGIFGSALAIWSYALSVYVRARRHFGEPYHRLDVAPDGLLVKGSRVSVRL